MAQKEVATRYDFKGTESQILEEDEGLALVSKDDSRLQAVEKVVREKLAIRGISARAYKVSDPEPASLEERYSFSSSFSHSAH